jgi:hypothetical protein
MSQRVSVSPNADLENELVVQGPFHKTFFNFLSKFRQRYINLDINLTYQAAHRTTVVEKVRNELKCATPTADIVMLPHYTTLMLRTPGQLRTMSGAREGAMTRCSRTRTSVVFGRGSSAAWPGSLNILLTFLQSGLPLAGG